ncbi:MAG TPA: aldehyde dehydrogenase (NADP(+)) [Streptosporangiaceae bacterium]|nr:aldehyde dehydrogenase (NADP(+)) [Streptosporangiaceae bacterium]
MTPKVISADPRTGAEVEQVATETSADEVAALCAAAAAAAPAYEALGRDGRAALLESVAAELDAAGDHIVALADRESALGTGRLTGELARTTFQLRFMAEVIRDGGYLDVAIDHADPGATPPRPDLRRTRVPLGPVAVFGASNFPLAFSVPGGDTASALAAGCPVVAKAHPAHPATSQACAEAIRRGLAAAPAGTFALVYGEGAGRALVTDPHIRAVGFTGSLRGGRALHDLAAARPEPIPFYGELGSLNPLVVTPGAAAARAAEIGRGAAESFTLGNGQFCTKPGLVFVPRGAAGERLVEALVAHAATVPIGPLLTPGIRAAYEAGVDRAAELPGVSVPARPDTGRPAVARGGAGEPSADATVVRVPADRLGEALLDEVFGPFVVVADYADDDDLAAALGRLRPALTATVHAEDDEAERTAPLVELLRRCSGRVVWNGYPTGVAVAWAMTHGGPYPASTSAAHTSVGAAAIQRWLRPVTYQSLPQPLLPPELREDNPLRVPRRVDGRLEPGDRGD